MKTGKQENQKNQRREDIEKKNRQQTHTAYKKEFEIPRQVGVRIYEVEEYKTRFEGY